jgi:H+-transporting ATPase
LTPQIATRAYELYEQQGRRDGQSVQNWDKAEREIRNDQAKAELKPETKAEPPSDLTPQLVKRVHKLYEEPGGEDIRAVQELERAKQEIH